jgi:hypothetical protein
VRDLVNRRRQQAVRVFEHGERGTDAEPIGISGVLRRTVVTAASPVRRVTAAGLLTQDCEHVVAAGFL